MDVKKETDQMRHLPRTQIVKLREYGYRLEGENWLRVSARQQMEEGFSVIKIVNGDTLTTVFIPKDILIDTETIVV